MYTHFGQPPFICGQILIALVDRSGGDDRVLCLGARHVARCLAGKKENCERPSGCTIATLSPWSSVLNVVIGFVTRHLIALPENVHISR
jgi:hypothetical protein